MLVGAAILQQKKPQGMESRAKEHLWEKVLLWVAAEFGFRNCPIFLADFSLEEKQIHFSKLRCFCKGENSKTILSSSKFPCALWNDAPDPSEILSPTKHVE